MVSYAPNTQYLNFQHMYDFVDYRSKTKPQMCMNEGSIYDYLYKNSQFSKFRSLIDKVGLAGFFSHPQENVSVFVPTDRALLKIPDEYFTNMDIGTARKVLNASTIPKRLKRDLLTSSPVSYYYTKNPMMRMYVTNINGQTRLNNCANIVQFDIETNNGIIHVIDNLLTENEDHFMN
jgi:uncharacterized surface protein with fasciclin (FAS1) repeats